MFLGAGFIKQIGSFSEEYTLLEKFKIMLGLFKRSKIESWEYSFLEIIFSRLPNKLEYLKHQLNEGVLNHVSFLSKARPNYVGFTYNKNIVAKYYKENERAFSIMGIEVYDLISNTFINIEVYINAGLIAGYSTPNNSKFKLDINQVDTTNIRTVFYKNVDYDKISGLLSEEAKKEINPDDVYSVELDNKEYFHIKDIGDGDFIGIDIDGNLYRIFHDPFEIKLLHISIEKALRE